MGAVAEGAVAVVAHLEPVLVVEPGAMCGTFHITKLHFVDSVLRVHVYREGHLQQPVELLPVHLCLESKPPAVRGQADVLREAGFADSAGHLHHALQAFAHLLHRYLGDGLHFLQDIVGIDVPGVEQAGHILVQAEPVHGLCGVLPAGLLQHKGHHFAPGVHSRPDPAVLQHIAVSLFLHGHSRFRAIPGSPGLCGHQRHRAAGRDVHDSLHARLCLLHRHSLALKSPGPCPKGLGQLHQSLPVKA